ncbi:MAG: hypothetical protein R3E01_10420 [Pirellulaceae bacterium]
MTKQRKQTGTERKKPAHEIRIGMVKATLWLNQNGESGDRYNTSFCRLYRVPEEKRESNNDTGWRESSSFGRDDLLALGKLADQVHSWIHEQRLRNANHEEE